MVETLNEQQFSQAQKLGLLIAYVKHVLDLILDLVLIVIAMVYLNYSFFTIVLGLIGAFKIAKFLRTNIKKRVEEKAESYQKSNIKEVS